MAAPRRTVSLLLVGIACLTTSVGPVSVAPASATPTADPEVARLADNAIPLSSIDPADEDLADLQPWKAAIGDARVVTLGEQHGNGAAYEAKTRLIKFLHREMGFDVLAFESGFYDCRKAQQLIDAGHQPASLLFAQCPYGLWSGSKQVLPPIGSFTAAAKTDRPLTLAGFDSRFGAGLAGSRGGLANRYLLADLDAFPGTHASAVRADPAKWALVEQLIGSLIGRGATEPPTVDEQARLLAALHDLQAEVGRLRGADPARDREIAFWRQMLRNVESHAKDSWLFDPNNPTPEGADIRDRQRAENLLWLADEAYPGRKIVVWAYNAHIVRGVGQVDARAFGYDETSAIMGELVAEALGDQAHALGFAAYDGQTAPRGWRNRCPSPRRPPAAWRSACTPPAWNGPSSTSATCPPTAPGSANRACSAPSPTTRPPSGIGQRSSTGCSSSPR